MHIGVLFNRHKLIKTQNTFDECFILDFCLLFCMLCPYLCSASWAFIQVYIDPVWINFSFHNTSTFTVSSDVPAVLLLIPFLFHCTLVRETGSHCGELPGLMGEDARKCHSWNQGALWEPPGSMRTREEVAWCEREFQLESRPPGRWTDWLVQWFIQSVDQFWFISFHLQAQNLRVEDLLWETCSLKCYLC